MTPQERNARLDAVMALPRDEDKLKAYAALIADERAELDSLVLMCRCADWMACAHPYPVRWQA